MRRRHVAGRVRSYLRHARPLLHIASPPTACDGRFCHCAAGGCLPRAHSHARQQVMLVNRVLSESVCRLSPLVMSDLVDEDVYLHSRVCATAAQRAAAATMRHRCTPAPGGTTATLRNAAAATPAIGNTAVPWSCAARATAARVCHACVLHACDLALCRMQPASLSASVIGSINFVSKFSQSLAPMLAYTLLPSLHSNTGADAGQLLPTDGPVGGAGNQPALVWRLLLLVPSVCVACQFVLWTRYSLHGAYLKHIKGSSGIKVADVELAA
jgi:hypothetical protein